MDTKRYLARIGAEFSTPDPATLRALQRAHLAAVPFENLSIHLGEPVVLSEDALFDKVVNRRRGGFCYELNGLFAAGLSALGYRVELLSARTHGDGGYGPPLDHLALRVEADGPWLVDVGFGRFSAEPLRLDTDAEQYDPEGVFRVVSGPDGIDVSMNGVPQYRLDTRAYALTDFVPTCWWQQTSPDSHFTRSVTCSLPTPAGRVTLSGNRLITTTGGVRDERRLSTDAEIRDAYRTYFGIELDRLPALPG
ncbi:arylamine N-acetyltransferase [Rugosimonospora acidiphila]|uniref:Arylamine N-acetyltransferase n=1 Tax=Rugosimonospora acidiphila TaxID=556531 RepID=A0ABP9S7F0_9ACTN